MSDVCCKEFKGWCRSFTRTELVLCVLQTVLLIAFIAFITFLALHFVVCFKTKTKNTLAPTEPKVTSTEYFTTTDNIDIFKNGSLKDNELNNNSINTSVSTDPKNKTTEPHITVKHIEIVGTSTESTTASTLDKGISCTWKPSNKTDAAIHYYEDGRTSSAISEVKIANTAVEKPRIESSYIFNVPKDNKLLVEQEDIPDGELADDVEKQFLLALVKIKSPQDVTFGCTLTVISGYWTLTAASCIEAIEKVDSLNAFVMMQGSVERYIGSIHPVADVMIHPLFQGVNATYDLAALKSENNLIKDGITSVTVPSLVDYFLVTVGERLDMLGYGNIRSTDRAPLPGSVRRVRALRLPLGRCGRGRGARARAGALCAGAACGQCAGAPLLRGRTLLAVMAANPQCGRACDPVLFANLALSRDWLDSFIYSH